MEHVSNVKQLSAKAVTEMLLNVLNVHQDTIWEQTQMELNNVWHVLLDVQHVDQMDKVVQLVKEVFI